MARKKIIISSAGGIAAGTPFVLGGYLFVQQATPPVAASGRLVQLSDVMQSITAKGLTAATKTFVLGKNVAEGANSGSSIYLGEDITAVTGGGVADRQIMLGVGIAQLAAFTNVDLTVLIGNAPTFSTATGQFGNSVLLGHNLKIGPVAGPGVVDTIGVVLLGAGAQVTGGTSVGVGSNCIAAAESVNIGNAALGGGIQAVGIGKASNVADNSVGIGRRARTGTNGVALGFSADNLTVDSSICVGRDTTATHANAIIIGRASASIEANSLVVGNDPGGTSDVRTIRLGPNVLAGYPGLSIFLPSATGGVSSAAPTTTIRAGLPTGASISGFLSFQVGLVHGADGVYQTATEVVRLQSGGTAGNPTIAFVSQISTPGAAVGTLTNAPAVGNPTIWAEVLYNGVLRKIPMW
jgi:hypothetical protein